MEYIINVVTKRFHVKTMKVSKYSFVWNFHCHAIYLGGRLSPGPCYYPRDALRLYLRENNLNNVFKLISIQYVILIRMTYQ